MQDNQFSRTALATAFFRAYHTAHDQPLIFADPLALPLLGQSTYDKLAEHFARALEHYDPQRAAAGLEPSQALAWTMRLMGAPAGVLCRARYAEDRLQEAMAQGVGQYVILGAGLDTFALRRGDLLPGLRVFEIDHPASQAFKRQRLAQAGLTPPPQLHFIPVDFSRQGLAEALAASDFDPQAPAFFSWLGVTYYLQEAEVMATLAAVAQSARAGASLIFDYIDSSGLADQAEGERGRLLRQRVAKAGEPMRSGLEAASLATRLPGVGLYLREDLGCDEITARYLAGRQDGYRLSGYLHLALARTGE